MGQWGQLLHGYVERIDPPRSLDRVLLPEHHEMATAVVDLSATADGPDGWAKLDNGLELRMKWGELIHICQHWLPRDPRFSVLSATGRYLGLHP